MWNPFKSTKHKLRDTNIQLQNKCVTGIKCTVWGIQSVITQYLCMVTYRNLTQLGDHFEMYRNIKSLCCVAGTNVVLQRWGVGEVDEGSQKVETSSYRINKYQGCNVQHNKYN